MADPEWTSRSQVFPGLHPRDPQRFPRFERGLQRLFDAAVAITDEEHGYGMFNYLDAHTYYTPGSPQMLHRVWQGQHYGAGRNAWLLYARSGDPRYYRVAKARTFHGLDMDTVGYAQATPQFKYHWPGAVYHCKGLVHWGGDASVIGHPTSIDHAVWTWYMTGERRPMDLVSLWHQTALQYSLVGELDREWLQPMGEMLEVYDATRDPRLLKPIYDIADGALPLDQPVGAWPSYHQYWGPRYDRQARDPRYLAFLKDLMAPDGRFGARRGFRITSPWFRHVWHTLATGDLARWRDDPAAGKALEQTVAWILGSDDPDPAQVQRYAGTWAWGQMSYAELPACFALSMLAEAGLTERATAAPEPAPAAPVPTRTAN
jgi:hypothetical protein